MKLTGKEDLRVQKTITSIKKAFEELLIEKDYLDITVTELSKRAMINKKTFYSYYDNLDDILKEMQEDISLKYLERTKGFNRIDDAAKITREFFYFSNEQGKAYEKITCGGSYALDQIRSQMIKKVADNTIPKPTLKEEMTFAFMRASTLEMYKFWVNGGKKIPLEEMIEMTISLICKGVDGAK